jgi:hypothetical protein
LISINIKEQINKISKIFGFSIVNRYLYDYMAIVYRHRRLDNNSIFYIGIGVDEKRAFQLRSRNQLWKNIVLKTDYKVEIIAENIDYNKAKELEIFLISLYGRRDLKNGILCNMTDGGDGNTNFSLDTKNKISNSLKGIKQSEETKLKRSNALKKVWENQDLRELKRKQSLELNRLGLIGTKGKPSKKKGIKISQEIKDKVSEGLKKHFQNNKPHNFKDIDIEIKNNIYKDYKNGIKKFQLHKKYNLCRTIIERLIKEYETK